MLFRSRVLDSDHRAQEFLSIELDAAFRAARGIPENASTLCFRMPDDSMEPTISSGDLVVINGMPMPVAGREPVSDKLYCIKINNYTVRQLKFGDAWTQVQALNSKKFATYTVGAQITNFSPVLAILPASTLVSLSKEGRLVIHDGGLRNS